MANPSVTILCPFFVDERTKCISCEDIFRRFRWRGRKEDWLRRYCGKDWELCPYAIELLKMYDRIERGADVTEEKDKQVNAALKKEMHSLTTMLGKAEAREKRKDEAYKKLLSKNRILEDRYKDIRKKLEVEQGKKVKLYEEVATMARIYEERFCYLLIKYGDGILSEKDMQAWSKGKEFALVANKKDEGGSVESWKAIVRERKKRINKNGL